MLLLSVDARRDRPFIDPEGRTAEPKGARERAAGSERCGKASGVTGFPPQADALASLARRLLAALDGDAGRRVPAKRKQQRQSKLNLPESTRS